MDRLKEFLQWNLTNTHNTNFKMAVSNEDREDTLRSMNDMVNLFKTGLTAEDIKKIVVGISDDQAVLYVYPNNISDEVLCAILKLQCCIKTGFIPDQIKSQRHNLDLDYKRDLEQRLLEEIGKKMFSAEVYNKDFNGVKINNLLCFGDVAEIIDTLFEEERK